MTDQETLPKAALTPRQERLIVELTRTTDVQAAARAAGVGRTTAHRWLHQPDFAEELRRSRTATYGEALNSIKALATRAAGRLAGLLDTQDERLLRCTCNDILRHALRIHEFEEIEQRLRAIEQQMNRINPGESR